MSLRARVSLATAAAVLVAVIACAVALYVDVRHEAIADVDAAMSEIGRLPASRAGLLQLERAITNGLAKVPRGAATTQAYLQFVDARGRVLAPLAGPPLPVTATVRAVARDAGSDAFLDGAAGGVALRVYALNLAPGTAVEIGHPLTDINATLHDMVVAAIVISIIGLALATAIGVIVSFTALRPVRRLSTAVRAVTDTGDVSHRVAVEGRDELSEVARAFNGMLAALGESLERQRLLVADASHVLRTPLAAARTNLEVLERFDDIAADERRGLLRAAIGQIVDLTQLVNNIIELARGQGGRESSGALALDELVTAVVAEARRNYPTVEFRLTTKPSRVWGSPDQLSSAITNLVDNAAKWTPPGSPVEIEVARGTISVRDHGPGVPAADEERIFDRFYRSLAASGVPGSGLGLAIAKQAAEAHDGTISVHEAPGGGAEFVLALPELQAS